MAKTNAKTSKAVKATRTVVRYVDQTIKALRENDARETSKRGKLLAMLLGSKTITVARAKFAKLPKDVQKVGFSSMTNWAVKNGYISLR